MEGRALLPQPQLTAVSPSCWGPSDGSALLPHGCAGSAHGPALPESSTARLSPQDGNSGVLQLQGEKTAIKNQESRGMKLMDAFTCLLLAFRSNAVLIGRDVFAIKANELTNFFFSFESKPAFIRNQKEKTLEFSVVQNCLRNEKSAQTESSDSARNRGNYHLPSSLLLRSIKQSD